MTNMNEIRGAYEEGAGRWTGCDWPTCQGGLGLDLGGMSSGQARWASGHWAEVGEGEEAYEDVTAGEEVTLADAAQHLRLWGVVAYPGGRRGSRLQVRGKSARRFCARALAAEWGFAAEWLGQVEADAAWAGEEARLAVAAAGRGDWDQALGHARRACSIESQYGDCRPWRRLELLIQEAATESHRSSGPFHKGLPSPWPPPTRWEEEG